ncbi:MAG: RNA polymerase sigma factor [Actinomycetota bacterium]
MTAEGTSLEESPGGSTSDAVLGRVVRAEAALVVTALSRSFGSLDIAEEAVAEAIEEALREWRVSGVPPRPGAWLTTAARRNALDRLRRDRRLREKVGLMVSEEHRDDSGPDERVPLLFGCCHPALAPEAQFALTLRAVLGVTTAQIARATFEPVATVAQRIVRAKRKIVASGVPLRIPEGPERNARVDLVLTVISVLYDTAHLRPGAGADADRNLADDAIWLARVVAEVLPGDAEPQGLLALLLFHAAREGGRSVEGELVPLPRQDRRRWDSRLIAQAHLALERAAALRRPGRWQLQAAIAACHADAPSAHETDWLQILVLYDLLLTEDPSPVVRLNRAVALAEVAGAAVALREVDALESRLSGFHLFHAVRGDMLRRSGRPEDARVAEQRAITLTDNEAERRLLDARLRRDA